jgi:hypothetical protein
MRYSKIREGARSKNTTMLTTDFFAALTVVALSQQKQPSKNISTITVLLVKGGIMIYTSGRRY